MNTVTGPGPITAIRAALATPLLLDRRWPVIATPIT